MINAPFFNAFDPNVEPTDEQLSILMVCAIQKVRQRAKKTNATLFDDIQESLEQLNCDSSIYSSSSPQ